MHRIIAAGTDAPEPISSILMDKDVVWVASGSFLLKYIRGKEVSLAGQLSGLLKTPSQVGRLTNPFEAILGPTLVFGPMLIALSEDGRRMLVWDITSGSKYPSSCTDYRANF